MGDVVSKHGAATGGCRGSGPAFNTGRGSGPAFNTGRGGGPAFNTGKLQLDHLLAEVSRAVDVAGRRFDLRDTLQRVMAIGIIPVALIEAEVLAGKTP